MRFTQLWQGRNGSTAWVRVDGSVGDYEGAPSVRETVIEWVGDRPVRSVKLNGVELTQISSPDKNSDKNSKDAIVLQDNTWTRDPRSGVVRVRAGKMNVTQTKTFEFALGN
jgi:hypothetical protein